MMGYTDGPRANWMAFSHHNELPPRFKTWTELYMASHTEGYEPTPYRMQIQDNLKLEIHIYDMDDDFVKARCFDEIEPNIFNEYEAHQLCGAVDDNFPGFEVVPMCKKINSLCFK